MKPRFAKIPRASDLYGIKPVMEALEAGKAIDKVWISGDADNPAMKKLMQMLRDAGYHWQKVPKAKLDNMVSGNHQGVLASISPVHFSNLEDVIASVFEKGEDPLIVIMDEITDVRNFGAIVRSASCAGAHAIVIPEKGGAGVNADSLKTSAGALMKIPVCKVSSLHHTLKILKQSGIKLAGATEKAKETLYEVDLTGPMALIMGSEDHGLSNDSWKQCDILFKIPLHSNGVDSLNVSVAAGISLFEILRKRNFS